MSNAKAWKEGIIDGYQSVKPSHIPPIPAHPATVPAGVRDTKKYFYQLGYVKGREMAG
jgi:hypothetical protein